MSVGALGVWPTLPPVAYLRRPRRQAPFPLGQPSCVLYSRARQGLVHGVRALGIAPGEILVPAYHHGAEVEAFELAGASCRFYAGAADLAPDEAELEAALSPRTRALHLIHNLGFPQDAAHWAAWCRRHGLLLIEDGAPAWLSTIDGAAAGSFGDLSVFSLYKTVGVPDGAAAICTAPLPAPRPGGALRLAATAKRHLAWLGQRVPAVARAAEIARRDHPFDHRHAFEPGDLAAGPSLAARLLLPRLLDPRIVERRRANYEYLLAAVGAHVPPPFDRLAEGAVPWVFPVVTKRKPGVLASLAADRVSAMDLWSVPHRSLAVERFPAAAERRASTVALPVHQGLRLEDLERIAAAALRALGDETTEVSPNVRPASWSS